MFKSIFADEMEAYLALKTFSVSDPVVSLTKRALSSLDQYLAEIDFPQKELTEDILTPWISSIPGKSKTINEKVGAVRGFVKYLDSLGIPAFLPESPKVKSEYIPYIYSEAEIQKIMHYADNLSPRKPGSCSPFLQLKIPMALRILYGCGTRLGETMALQRKDVCFKEGTLFLRKTKFSKERLIPIHDSLLEILKRYCLTLGIMDNPEAYLFPGDKPGRHYTKRQMDAWFAEILKLANIDQRDKSPNDRGACLHCFRHLFVLKSMQQLEAVGHPVDINDLLLPTYLGHKCLIDTDQYRLGIYAQGKSAKGDRLYQQDGLLLPTAAWISGQTSGESSAGRLPGHLGIYPAGQCWPASESLQTRHPFGVSYSAGRVYLPGRGRLLDCP